MWILLLMAPTLLGALATPAIAQGDGSMVAIMNEYTGAPCWLHTNDPTPSPFHVVIIHKNAASTRAVRFRLVTEPGTHLSYVGESVYLGDSEVWGFTGDTQSGISIDCGYSHPWYRISLMRVSYMLTAAPDACSAIRFAPHPDATSRVEIMPHGTPVWGTPSEVNDLVTLGLGCQIDNWCVLPVEESTWGQIKALYQ